jgi:hypothetical protein
LNKKLESAGAQVTTFRPGFKYIIVE